MQDESPQIGSSSMHQADAAPLSIAQIVLVGLPALLFWLCLVWLTMVSVPRADKFLGEFRMQSPLVTRWVIDSGWWIIPGLVLICVVVCLAVRKRWLMMLVFVTAPAIASVIIVLSIYVPAAQLVVALQHDNAPIWAIFWK